MHQEQRNTPKVFRYEIGEVWKVNPSSLSEGLNMPRELKNNMYKGCLNPQKGRESRKRRPALRKLKGGDQYEEINFYNGKTISGYTTRDKTIKRNWRKRNYGK